jgi:hypothetical protein
MNDLTINISDYDDPAALLKPDNDLTADQQTIFLRLRPQKRSVSVEVLRKVVRDSTPMEIYHGREYRIKVDPQVDAARLRPWVEDHADLIERICDGHSVKWDGSNQTGRLTEDAQVAKDRLRALLVDGQRHPSYRLRDTKRSGDLPDRDFETVERGEVGVPTHDIRLWQAGDWLAHAEDEIIEEFGLSEDTSEERFAEVARELEEEARTEGPIKLHGTGEYLRGLFETVDL